jgi:hypothetical protein
MDSIVTVYNLDKIIEFIDLHGTSGTGERFRAIINEAADRLPELEGAPVFRLTNDPAIRQGYTSNMEKSKTVAHFPFPEGTYVFTLIEMEGQEVVANVTMTGHNRILIVVNLDSGTVEDLTHLLV